MKAAGDGASEPLHVSSVMAGLVPAIHALLAAKTWMPGTRPGMTRGDTVPLT